MHIRQLTTAIAAGLIGAGICTANDQFDGPGGGMFVTPQNGDPAFGIFPFGVPQLQSITTDNITFELIPNVNLYDDNPGDPVWRNNGGAGPDGGSIVAASTSFETDITPDLQSCTFNFNVDAIDINLARYSVTGYIRVLKQSDFTFGTLAEQTIAVNSFGPKPLALAINPAWAGELLQVGWTVEGLNANPADDWGSVTVSIVDLFAVSNDNAAPQPDPMEFAVTPFALSGTQISMTASNAVDIYDVQYQFTNITAGTSSDWQSSPVWVDSGPSTPPATNVVDLVIDPTYSNLNGNWQAFEGNPVFAGRTPSDFVSVAGGVATVTPASANEYNFYQTYGFGGVPALELGKVHKFSIVSDNDSTAGTSSAVAFVKAFDGGFGFIASEFQTVPLAMDGSTTTIEFTPVSGAIYQLGTFTIGTTSGSYDVSNPSLIVTNIVEGSSGLTPDTEYFYQVRARDLSPQTNVTAWSVATPGTSTVFDVTAPMPDPMAFAVLPVAISDNAISMTATNAVDDFFAVEYLFSNTVNNTTSGWQSDPSWIQGNIPIENGDFEDGGTGFEFNSGGAASAATTNISGDTSALLTSDGGFSVVVKAITNLASTGFSGGDTITVAADVRALAGKNNGNAGFKVESWQNDSQIDSSGDIFITPTESWENYTIDYTIASGADEIRIVLLVVNGSDSEYLYDNVAAFSGGPLDPGTEYTYVVKARDTSPNNNETAFSAPASATTSGMGPVTPFSIDSAEYVDGVGFAFGWQGTSGYTYDLEYTTNLVTGPWMVDPSPGASGILSSGGTESATSTVNGVSIFYRVITQ